jgi:chorismate mutase
MFCRGIRGAVAVDENSATAILTATIALLGEIVAANAVVPEDIGSVVFSVTPDLDAVYPAQAARTLGWDHVPLLCLQEMAVPGSLPRCIRVLIHWNTELRADAVHHVYLGAARSLRPDLVGESQKSE